MRIQTKFLGDIDIEDKEVYTFADGLPGFPEYKKFAILPVDVELPIALLQSIENAEIGFIVALPFVFKSDYSFELSEEDLECLQIENEKEVLTYSILTLKETFAESTMNLLAPIVLNVKTRIGKQIVLQDNALYSLRYPIGKLEGSAK